MNLIVLGTLRPAGEVARGMADLWWPMLVLGTAAFVVFCALLAGALRRRGSTDEDGVPVEDDRGSRRWLVGAGVVQPVVLIAITFALTLIGMRAIPDSAPDGSLVVEVTGHQWWYEVHYPEQGVTTANEMHIPAGEPVELHLTSADVVHSFWVPRLAGKTDMLPDGPTTMVIESDQPGEYTGACAEFCGLQHTRMGFLAVVEEREDFEAWVAAQQEPAAEPEGQTARYGQELFLAGECVECHTIAGTPAQGEGGPDLTHLAGRSTLGAATVPNTPAQLEAWIRDPHAIKAGVDMQASDLEDEDLDALVTYLQGLQ